MGAIEIWWVQLKYYGCHWNIMGVVQFKNAWNALCKIFRYSRNDFGVKYLEDQVSNLLKKWSGFDNHTCRWKSGDVFMVTDQ